MPSRRDLLATTAGALAALAGCTTGPVDTDDERSPPDDSPSDDPGGRPTATPRSPTALSVSGEWPQRGGGPGHAGSTDATGAPEDGSVHWHLRRVRSGPAAVADDHLYHYAKLGEDRSGEPTLTRTREPDAGTAHPIYGVPHLVARDASEGRIQWAAELPAIGVGWPAVGNGRVVATASGWVGALDATNGDERWSHDLGDHPVRDPTVVGDAAVVPMPGISEEGDDHYVPPKVRCYDLADGAERWTVEPPERGLGVAATDDAVVLVSHGYDDSGTVAALSLSDGSERWRTDVSGGFFDAPVVADGTAYVTDSAGGLGALSMADGSERWRRQGAADGVAVGPDAVYAAGDGVTALDPADGSERWRVETDSEGLVAPAVAGDTVYVGGGFSGFQALSAADGTERWSHSFPEQVVEGDMVMRGPQAQPTVVDGAVYVFAADGLYAFGPA